MSDAPQPAPDQAGGTDSDDNVVPPGSEETEGTESDGGETPPEDH
jgi:hypothetical protein